MPIQVKGYTDNKENRPMNIRKNSAITTNFDSNFYSAKIQQGANVLKLSIPENKQKIISRTKITTQQQIRNWQSVASNKSTPRTVLHQVKPPLPTKI